MRGCARTNPRPKSAVHRRIRSHSCILLAAHLSQIFCLPAPSNEADAEVIIRRPQDHVRQFRSAPAMFLLCERREHFIATFAGLSRMALMRQGWCCSRMRAVAPDILI